jgi:AcrR family transcriptional regulator
LARTGRRPGTSGSREAILAAARERFAADGYDRASMRSIAATAEVDPGLVRHYFGSKEHLFVAAMEFPIDPAEEIPRIVAAGREGLGERLANFFLEAWDPPNGPFIALLRSVTTNEQAAQMLREFISREVIGRVATLLKLDRAPLRTGLAASHLIGLAFIRYVIKLEPIASMDRARLARDVGPSIDRYFDAAI